MFLRRSIQKTKNFFHKRMRNLKSLLVSGYHKLPTAPSFNAVPRKTQQLDNLYRDISEEWEPDHDDELMDIKKNNIMAKSATSEGNVSHRSSITSHAEQSSVVKTTSQEEKKTASWHEQRKRGCFFIESGSGKERGYILVEKMKELEMMDEYDMDHVLDVEEVLHHYSRLTCPVYLDIVDKFFTDMYSEFLLPQPSASLNNSRRRLHSVRF